MSDYRKVDVQRCEACGEGGILEFDAQGRQLCRSCAARATVKALDEQQHADQRVERMIQSVEEAVEEHQRAMMLRRCPTCGPTMVGTERRHVAGSSIGNVSGVTYQGTFKCTKCGRRVSIFPTKPTILRALLILGLTVALPFVSSAAAYLLGGLAAFLAIFALADLFQRLRYPVVRR